MGSTQKRKGKVGEREAAAELGTILGCDARRGVQYHGGPDSPDVVLDGVSIHVEAKRTETLSLYTAVDQAVGEVPALGFLGDMTGREQGIVLAYRDALDKAGVKWKEVGRE